MSRHHSARAQSSARRALAPLVASGNAVCWRCGLPIDPAEPWDAGHVDDLGLGGNPAGPTVPEHVACNRSAGGRLGNQLRRASRRRVAEWLAFFPRGPLTEPRAASIFPPEGWAVLTPTRRAAPQDLRCSA